MEPTAQFVFTTCQVGAEAALKAELARLWPDWRLSFSRPGFVTFKVPAASLLPEPLDLQSVFARTYGLSLGRVSGVEAGAMARQAWELIGPRHADHLHVWQRDAALPGDNDFEPGETILAQEVGRQLCAACPHDKGPSDLPLNRIARPGQSVFDCVLVQPSEWWVGTHTTLHLPSRWPGGVPLIQPAESMISRAYLKLQEALAWSRMPLAAGDCCVEIGSAPGGSAQLLLERGLRVIGIDPAEMDESIANHPHFRHVRKRAAEVRRRELSEARWLLADSNVAPQHTLDSVEAIVTHASLHIRGLLLTLKLPDWDLAAEIPAYLERIRSWGFRRVQARQLAFNRQEICVAAMRNRAMRRFTPHASR